MPGTRLYTPRMVSSSTFTTSYAPEEYGRLLANERDRFKTRFSFVDLALTGDHWHRPAMRTTVSMRSRWALTMAVRGRLPQN
jgi:hypothetical protein